MAELTEAEWDLLREVLPENIMSALDGIVREYDRLQADWKDLTERGINAEQNLRESAREQTAEAHRSHNPSMSDRHKIRSARLHAKATGVALVNDYIRGYGHA